MFWSPAADVESLSMLPDMSNTSATSAASATVCWPTQRPRAPRGMRAANASSRVSDTRSLPAGRTATASIQAGLATCSWACSRLSSQRLSI
jgi:hypothetical protein